MKKNKIAFTMIELIVVTSIMVLLTTSSVFYFFDFTDNRELIIQVDILEDSVADLNKQVKNFEISDYDLYFTAGLNYYTGSINNLGTNNLVGLSLDDYGTGTLSVSSGGINALWRYTIYEEEKEIITKITSSNNPQEYLFDISKNYTVVGYIGGEPSNTVILRTLSTQESGIELTSPESGLFSNKNNIITSLDMIFEKGGSTYNLELK